MNQGTPAAGSRAGSHAVDGHPQGGEVDDRAPERARRSPRPVRAPRHGELPRASAAAFAARSSPNRWVAGAVRGGRRRVRGVDRHVERPLGVLRQRDVERDHPSSASRAAGWRRSRSAGRPPARGSRAASDRPAGTGSRGGEGRRAIRVAERDVVLLHGQDVGEVGRERDPQPDARGPAARRSAGRRARADGRRRTARGGPAARRRPSVSVTSLRRKNSAEKYSTWRPSSSRG